MALQILGLETIIRGCKVDICLDAPNALEYLKAQCSQHGWQVSDPKPYANPSVVHVFVSGPTADQFKLAFQGNTEFEFRNN